MRLLEMLHVSASLSVFVAFSGSWYTKLFSVIDHLDLDRFPGVFKHTPGTYNTNTVFKLCVWAFALPFIHPSILDALWIIRFLRIWAGVCDETARTQLLHNFGLRSHDEWRQVYFYCEKRNFCMFVFIYHWSHWWLALYTDAEKE